MRRAYLRFGFVGAAALALSACTLYGESGVGYNSDYGYGYGDEGYGDQGYGGGYYQGGYGGGAYDNYYGDPYGYRSVPYGYAGFGFGWSGEYYYPGTGYYVYDRRGQRRQWSGDQQRYWQERARDRQEFRAERRDDRRALDNGQVTPEQFRADRMRDRDAFRADRGQDRREFRGDRRDDRREFRQDRRGGGVIGQSVAPQAPVVGVAPQASGVPPQAIDRSAVREQRREQRVEQRAEQRAAQPERQIEPAAAPERQQPRSDAFRNPEERRNEVPQ